MFINKYIKQILAEYKNIWALEYLSRLANWELETYMPTAGAGDRGEALAKVKILMQKLFLDKNFLNLLDKAQAENDLNDYEQAVIRVLNRQKDQYQKLPPAFIEEMEKTHSKALVAWRKAREQDDFSIFAELLEKIFQQQIQMAEYLGYKENPYDALLDLFEEDSTTNEVSNFFAEITPVLDRTFKYISSSASYTTNSKLENESYNQAAMVDLNNTVLEYFSWDKDKLRLDTSTHPFTSTLTSNDVRITTRYHEQDFLDSFSSTIHEFGHALYDLQCAPELAHTPIHGGQSLGIHESQSRFWENIVGRSESFIKALYPQFQKLGAKFANYTPEDYYKYFNQVKPGFIRVEADEVTYHYHILVRFNIEKALINKEISIKEAPEYWNNQYQKYLGITPPSNAKGILQDIHWSMGAIGYFPTYSMGTVLSSTWAEKIATAAGDLPDLVSTKAGIVKIKSWLQQNLHKFGATFTLKQLLNEQTGQDRINVQTWANYLESKYKSIY